MIHDSSQTVASLVVSLQATGNLSPLVPSPKESKRPKETTERGCPWRLVGLPSCILSP